MICKKEVLWAPSPFTLLLFLHALIDYFIERLILQYLDEYPLKRGPHLTPEADTHKLLQAIHAVLVFFVIFDFIQNIP